MDFSVILFLIPVSLNVITAVEGVLLFLFYKGGKLNLGEGNEPGKNPTGELLSFEGWLDQ